ncbi:uncharacterized protein ACA1_301390 [Acanthamoeba castellanii str. Neff]|uniref:Uncharacterized protein n=1 Tax=Acanthamoeba castellanii (strain ATCC 30010 / Neff) TaxID=1257118 RepID=L8GJG0_ACACF|nr:uncharacterized protein ACA1_301390 [Acanthamoeba castellanii str. Neff]ELR13137.1 hypothetical protein ACA1_301390 [Acanthamoeba castellanii str. Neff]
MDELDEKHQEPSSEATHRASKSDVFIQKLLETKACLEAKGFTLLDDARPPLDQQSERDAQELWRVCQRTNQDCKYKVERVGGSDDTIKVHSSAYDASITTRLALQGIVSPIKNAFPCDGGRAHLIIQRLLDGNFTEVVIKELSAAGSSPTQGELARFDNYAKQLYSLLWGVLVDNCLNLDHLLLPSDLLYSRVGNAPARYLRLDTHANRPSELPHEITLAWKKQRIAEHINSFINSCVSKFSDFQEAASKLDGAVTAIRKTALLFEERHSADQYTSVRFSGLYLFLLVSQQPVDEPS